jgi:uncharacterized protein DUF3105
VAKPNKTSRRDVVDQIRSQQKRADKRQGAVIVGVCVLVALLIVGIAAFRPIKDWWDLREYNNLGLADVGAPASVCQDVTTKKASGTQQHVQPGTNVDYKDAPPAFGEHEEYPDSMERKLYTEEDRPRVEMLVHNLEHGYTILWYDQSIADDADQLNVIDGIADKFRSDSNNLRYKFIAAPWTAQDEKESGKFPDGMHIAISHWSAGGSGETDTSKQVGVFQYCSQPSGEALKAFMLKYPYTDSPEPDAM